MNSENSWLMNKEKLFLGIIALVYLIFFFFNACNPLFWDTIYYSGYMSLWYYATNFSTPFLPDTSGLYPFHAMYIALCMKLFGKSLFIAHLAMLPVLLTLLYQLYVLTKRFIPQYTSIVLVCLLADPALASQSILVSPDLTLVCFYLLCLNAILDKKYWLLALCLPILAILHIRGTIAVIALGLTQMVFLYFFERDRNLRSYLNAIACYLPSVLIVIAWQYVQFVEKGWWIHGPDHIREIEGLSSLIFNLLIIGKNFLDTGRIIIWLILIPMVIYYFRNVKTDRQFQLLIICFAIPLVVFSGFMVVVIERMIGHRYYMVCYVLVTLIACYAILNWMDKSKKLFFTIIITLVLISGNFWVWPDHVSKGWDSTLAHIPYFKLKMKMVEYIKANNIDPHTIGTGFPDHKEERLSMLNNSDWHMEPLNSDFNKNQYIYQSNVHNDFSDGKLAQLKRNWILIKEFKSGQVYVRLYKNPSIFAQ